MLKNTYDIINYCDAYQLSECRCPARCCLVLVYVVCAQVNVGVCACACACVQMTYDV